jgi:phospholipid transport system substrate-binding protein
VKWTCSLLLSLALINTYAATRTPTAVVEETVSSVIKVLKDDTLDREGRWQKIGEIINRRFDFQTMSQSVLATNWQSATPDEKRKFVEFFSQYLENTYRTKIESYTDQRIEFTGEKIQDGRAWVDSLIHTSNTEIPVSYKLIDKDGDWYAYDVVIEGISLVNNYRNTYAAIIKNEGMDGLLSDLQTRIARYKAERQAENTAGDDDNSKDDLE